MSHNDVKALPNQVVMMTTSCIPVPLSFCHFVTLSHYWLFLTSIFSEHLPQPHKPWEDFHKDKKILVYEGVYNGTAQGLNLGFL